MEFIGIPDGTGTRRRRSPVVFPHALSSYTEAKASSALPDGGGAVQRRVQRRRRSWPAQGQPPGRLGADVAFFVEKRCNNAAPAKPQFALLTERGVV